MAGSGRRRASRRVAPHGRVPATDVSSNLLACAKHSARTAGLEDIVDTEVMDGENLAVDAGSFDSVISRVGLIHFPDRQRALKGMRRALRPGGRLTAVTYSSPEANTFFSIPVSVIRAAATLPAPSPGQPGPFSVGDEDVLRAALKDAGFMGVEVRRIPAPLRLPSAADCVPFERASFGALRQQSARLATGHSRDPRPAAGLMVIGGGAAFVAVLGPLPAGVIECHVSSGAANQIGGGDVASLVLVAPACVIAAALVARYPGTSERFFPLFLGLLVLALAIAIRAWSAVDASRLPATTRRLDRLVGWFAPLVAAFLTFGSHLPGLLDAWQEQPSAPEYLADPVVFWLVKLMDLGLVVPALVAIGWGESEGRRLGVANPVCSRRVDGHVGNGGGGDGDRAGNCGDRVSAVVLKPTVARLTRVEFALACVRRRGPGPSNHNVGGCGGIHAAFGSVP